jgi:hypothetical protein
LYITIGKDIYRNKKIILLKIAKTMAKEAYINNRNILNPLKE